MLLQDNDSSMKNQYKRRLVRRPRPSENRRVPRFRLLQNAKAVGTLCGAALLFAATPALGAGTTFAVGPVTDISASCSGPNAEVEQAADVALGYVYETWMG